MTSALASFMSKAGYGSMARTEDGCGVCALYLRLTGVLAASETIGRMIVTAR